MLNSVQFFDLVKAEKGLTSDYQLAKYLDISPGIVCKHRKKAFGVDDKTSIKIAQALKLDPAYVLMCSLVESAKRTEAKAALMRILILCELNRTQLSCGWQPGEMQAA